MSEQDGITQLEDRARAVLDAYDVMAVYLPVVNSKQPDWNRDAAELVRELLAECACLAAALAEQEQEIDCPHCGETVKQVSSATLSLALSQHVRWACQVASKPNVALEADRDSWRRVADQREQENIQLREQLAAEKLWNALRKSAPEHAEASLAAQAQRLAEQEQKHQQREVEHRMTNETTPTIDAIRARLLAASPQPWAAFRMTHEDRGDDMTPEEIGEYVKNSVVKSAAASGSSQFLFVSVQKPDGAADVCHVGNGPTSPANADFIAHAPEDIAFLLSENARLAAALAEQEQKNQTLARQLDEALEGDTTLLDAFDAGQAASGAGESKDSNPFEPGDSWGVPLLRQYWDDGYDLMTVKELRASLAAQAQEIADTRAVFFGNPPIPNEMTLVENAQSWRNLIDQLQKDLAQLTKERDALKAERDEWRSSFGLQTSNGWQTAAEAKALWDRTWKAEARSAPPVLSSADPEAK